MINGRDPTSRWPVELPQGSTWVNGHRPCQCRPNSRICFCSPLVLLRGTAMWPLPNKSSSANKWSSARKWIPMSQLHPNQGYGFGTSFLKFLKRRNCFTSWNTQSITEPGPSHGPMAWAGLRWFAHETIIKVPTCDECLFLYGSIQTPQGENHGQISRFWGTTTRLEVHLLQGLGVAYTADCFPWNTTVPMNLCHLLLLVVKQSQCCRLQHRSPYHFICHTYMLYHIVSYHHLTLCNCYQKTSFMIDSRR